MLAGLRNLNDGFGMDGSLYADSFHAGRVLLTAESGQQPTFAKLYSSVKSSAISIFSAMTSLAPAERRPAGDRDRTTRRIQPATPSPLDRRDRRRLLIDLSISADGGDLFFAQCAREEGAKLQG
jgi:hypothetical protein